MLVIDKIIKMVMITAVRKIKILLEIKKSIEIQEGLNFSYENSTKYKQLWKYISDVCKLIMHLDETKVECIFNSVKLNLLFKDIISIYQKSNAFKPALDSFINEFGDGFVIDYYEHNSEFINQIKIFTESIISDNEYDINTGNVMKEKYLSRNDLTLGIINNKNLYEILETKNFELMEKKESIIDIIYPLLDLPRDHIFSDAANSFASIGITMVQREDLIVYLETRWNIRFIIYNATKPQIPYKLTNTLEFQNKAILNSILHTKRNNFYSNESILNIENIAMRDYATKLSSEIKETKQFAGLSEDTNVDILYNVNLENVDTTQKSTGVFGVNYPFIVTDVCTFSDPFTNKIIKGRNNDNVKYICIWYNFDNTVQLIKNHHGICIFNSVDKIPNYKEAFDYLRFRDNQKLIMPKSNNQFNCKDPIIVNTIEFDLRNIMHKNKYIKGSLFQDKLDEYFKHIGFTKNLPLLINMEEELNIEDVKLLLNLYVQNLPSKEEVDKFINYWV